MPFLHHTQPFQPPWPRRHAMAYQYLSNHPSYSAHTKAKSHGKINNIWGKHVPLQFKGRIMTDINNAAAQRAVQITERTEHSLLVAYKSGWCWWRALHTRERQHEKTWKNGGDNKTGTGEEERKHEWEMIISTVYVCLLLKGQFTLKIHSYLLSYF